MDEEPTTLSGLRSNIAKRAADVKVIVTAFTQSVASHLATAETAAANAKIHAESTEAQLTVVTASSKAISKLESDANVAYTDFDAVVKNAMDQKVSIKNVVAAVADAHEEAQELKTEISEFRDESLRMQGDIGKSRDDSEEMQKTLSTVLADSQDIRNSIEKTYKIATDAGLAGSLSKRTSNLQWQSIVWASIALISFILTVLITYNLIPDLIKQGQEIPIILGKVIYISPTALFTIFAIIQYRNERRLLEEYAFKAAMANSLESYTQLLGREFDSPEFREQILDFVLPAMRNIYDREPLVAPKMTFGWSLGNKFAKLEAIVKEEASTITAKTVQAKEEISTQIGEITEEINKPTTKSSKSSSSAT